MEGKSSAPNSVPFKSGAALPNAGLLAAQGDCNPQSRASSPVCLLSVEVASFCIALPWLRYSVCLLGACPPLLFSLLNSFCGSALLQHTIRWEGRTLSKVDTTLRVLEAFGRRAMEAVGKSVACAPSAIARVRTGGGKPSAAAGPLPAFGRSQLSDASLKCSFAAAGPVDSSSRDGRLDICAAFVSAGGLCSDRGSILTSRFLRSRNAGVLPGPGVTSRKQQLVVRANDRPSAGERVLAAVSYFLPLLDGIQYGRYFFQQFPVAETAFYPLFPLLQAYKSIPYSNLIVFFTLYLGVVRNERTGRYVKFNAMQAVVLDVLLILPQVIERIVSPRGGLGFQILVLLYNTLFLFLVVSFIYGVVSCLLGKTPRLPLVADAADAQV